MANTISPDGAGEQVPDSTDDGATEGVPAEGSENATEAIQQQAWRMVAERVPNGVLRDTDNRLKLLRVIDDQKGIAALAGEILAVNPVKAVRLMESVGGEFTKEELLSAADQFLQRNHFAHAVGLIQKADLPPEVMRVMLEGVLARSKDVVLGKGGRNSGTHNDIDAYCALYEIVNGNPPSAQELEQMGDSVLAGNFLEMAKLLFGRAVGAIRHADHGSDVGEGAKASAADTLAKRLELKMHQKRFELSFEGIGNPPERFLFDLERLGDIEGLRRLAAYCEKYGDWKTALEVRRSWRLIAAGDPQPDREWFEKATDDVRISKEQFIELCKEGGLTDKLIVRGDEYAESFVRRMSADMSGVFSSAMDFYRAAGHTHGMLALADSIRGNSEASGWVLEQAYGIYKEIDRFPVDPDFFRKLGGELSRVGDIGRAHTMFWMALELERQSTAEQSEQKPEPEGV